MLVLSRKIGEEILLPQSGISFSILQIRGNRVRVGVCAPAEVDVFRTEVWDRFKRAGEVREKVPSRDESKASRTVSSGL